jgi:hypothetical protein
MMALAVLAFGTVAQADLMSCAHRFVKVSVEPNVGVSGDEANVESLTIQTGQVCADVDFTIVANKEVLDLYVCASGLYKGNNPNSTVIIPLDTDEPALITVPAGGEVGGAPGTPGDLAWTGPSDTCDTDFGTFPTLCTETKAFDSGQPFTWDQTVTVTVCWIQEIPVLPMGEYGGCVVLCMLIPV